jgi:signal transduction histidine kinase
MRSARAGSCRRRPAGDTDRRVDLCHRFCHRICVVCAPTAHEISQPLSGIITNASTSIRMLDANPPNLAGARQTARRTLRDGNRAADVIARLRALFSKKLPTLEPLDLNEATREVIALSSSELQRSQVDVRAELADDLPSVRGDRVQLQQVILNLLRNASEAMDGIDDRPRRVVIKTARSEHDDVRLSVEDVGVGLDTGSTRLREIGSSRRSTRPRPTAWASVCRSVDPLSRGMEDASGQHRMMVRESR